MRRPPHGTPSDDHQRRMTPPTPRRTRGHVWRMLVSALAGGGLTAVSMGGSLSDEAVAASSEHTGTVPLTVTESGAGTTGTTASGSTGATGSGSTGTTGAGSTGTTASGSQQSGTGHTTTTTPELGTPTRPIVVAPAPRR